MSIQIHVTHVLNQIFRLFTSYQIFISYRREGGSGYAQSIFGQLTNHGYKCFYDRETMGAGSFDIKIYNKIEECEDFLLVLPINGLNRCNDPEDWVRKEIEHAMKFNKNIIPIMEQGFEFPNDLPDSLKSLSKKNGIYLNWDFFGEGIEKLERNFLYSKVRYSNLHRKYKTLPIMSAILILTIIVIFAFSPRQSIAEINSNDEVTANDVYMKKIKERILHDNGSLDNEISSNSSDTEKFTKTLEEAEKGNSESMVKVADYYGGMRDFKKSFTWALKAAEAGNIEGMFRIALAYSFGLGVEENKEQARKYFTEIYEQVMKEADLNDQRDMLGLGTFYLLEYEGLDLEDAGKNAFNCFMKSADLGDEGGRFFVGLCYLMGIGTKQNDEKAFECFNQIAYNWGQPQYVPAFKMMENGEFVRTVISLPPNESDWKEVVMLFVAYCYAEGRGTTQDYNKAFEWFEKSADLGNAEAMANIGAYYWQGKGVEKDYDRAFNWCLRAAEAGSVTAMNTLGKIYYFSEGHRQNYEKAFEYFQKAATAGDVDAMKNLSIMYRNGDGVSKDENKAKEWEQKYEQYQKKLKVRKL